MLPCQPPPPFSQHFLLTMMPHGIKNPFGQHGSGSLAMSSPSLLTTSTFMTFYRGEWRDRVDAGQALPRKTQNISV